MKNNTLPQIRLSIADNAVQFSVSDGWNAEFIGADFPQLVDDNLVIHTPLKDMTAVLSFKCRKGSEIAERDCPLHIKGAYGAAEKKPNVIPEPAQWHSTGGVFKNLSTYSYCPELKAEAEAFAAEFSRATGKRIKVSENGDVRLTVDSSLVYLGDEGYEIVCDADGISVKAPLAVGAVWAGKTICQLMAQGGFPCGMMRDYPRYSVRGFMLDVGRKPVSLATLEKIVDDMAWYKMNDFHVHLNDNYIWLEDYADCGDKSTFDAYQAFRLESALKNEKGETPTSADYAYTKAEFNSFMKKSLEKGVHITPEIDMPAHALAFTKVFPEYAVMGEVSPLMKKRPLTDHINVAKPEAVEFVKGIFDEYTKGENPVFPEGTTVHIGADEFLTDYGAYRRFINDVIPYLKQTNTVRLWGSLSWIKDEPETPIAKDAIDKVQMNLWSNQWADGREMYDMGYNLINTIDHQLYIVPNGTKIRAPYMDFINKKRAFRQFEPNRVRLKKSGKYIELPAGNKQMLGGCFAIWQDNIDKKSKGITEQDLYDRFADSAAFMAEKNWGSCTDKHTSKEVDVAVGKMNSSVLKKENVFRAMRDIKLTGGSCFIDTECFNLGATASLNMVIEFDEIKPGQIIMEADAPYGTYDVRITKSGKLGFTAECYEYEFDYTPIPNKKLNITIETKPLRTYLKTGCFMKKKAQGSFSFNGTMRNDKIKNTSFNIPTARIGSKTNSVKARIYSISVKQ